MSRKKGGRRDSQKVKPWVKVLAIVFAIIMLLSILAGFIGVWPFGGQEEPTVTDWSYSGYSPVASSTRAEPEPEPEPPIELTFTEEETAKLDAMLSNWAAVQGDADDGGHSVAVFFKDLDSGLEYVYNPDKKFIVASVNKAPYALYLYEQIEAGVASLEETFYITPQSVESSLENSGKIKNDPTLPRNYTMEEMLLNLLRYSDTAAMRILLQRYPVNGFIEYAQEKLPLHYPEDIRELMNARICALDAGVYLQALYDYTQDGLYGDELKTHLTESQYPMIRSEYPVAHKYGWDVGAYHDMALVYAPHPYALAILTDKDNGTPSALGMFATIAKTFEEILQGKWAEIEDNLQASATYK